MSGAKQLEAKASEEPNITETIYRALRRRILRNEWAPGERLPGERELSESFRTTRNTLREAIRKLEQSRLVTVRHGQGVTVADFRRTGTMELLTPFLEEGTDSGEKLHLLEDILPARRFLIEHATRLAVRRASKDDLERLADITALLVSVFETRDVAVMSRGEQRWLGAVVDAAHSVALRWIANPLLDAFRDLLERFPTLWIFDETYPDYLQSYLRALRNEDEEAAIKAMRRYFKRIDTAVLEMLKMLLPEPQGPALAQRRHRGMP
jgi:GntR family transcriptional regulator, transcriptional repressor for pyruvate dehydrogenase complex